MLGIAERIEGLQTSDREVDAEIATLAGWVVKYSRGDPEPYYEPRIGWSWQKVLPYTDCLTAAMTLLPEGWRLLLLRQEEDGSWACQLKNRSPRLSYQIACNKGQCAASPALAVCAAAFRARTSL
jgi:hypothetical protein